MFLFGQRWVTDLCLDRVWLAFMQITLTEDLGGGSPSEIQSINS
jgi:hypothetical protein